MWISLCLRTPGVVLLTGPLPIKVLFLFDNLMLRVTI